MDKFKFCNVSMDIEERLNDLVSLMTAEEKAGQLQARSCPPIDRLGVPFFCWGQNWVTGNFPIAPGMAATWNLSAIKGMGQDAAQDIRAHFNQRTANESQGYTCPGSIVTWGPTMNIIRDPRWGRYVIVVCSIVSSFHFPAWNPPRNFETPSEDPFLVAEYVRNFVEGAQQGEDKRFVKSIVTVKHWAAYSVDNYDGPDGKDDRYHYNAEVDMYDFFDTYAPGFKAAVKAGTKGVMCRSVL
jgi:beta-glucosidase-like glycosyl hydrolase